MRGSFHPLPGRKTQDMESCEWKCDEKESCPMLVLSRKKNQSIVIGGNTVITVIEISGNKIRLGIQAPNEIIVLRGELQPNGEITKLEPDTQPTDLLPEEAPPTKLGSMKDVVAAKVRQQKDGAPPVRKAS